MTRQELLVAHNDFVSERIAIIMEIPGKDEAEAIAEAREQWEKYKKRLDVR
jgi:DNA polymerase IIIc chi subunit